MSIPTSCKAAAIVTDRGPMEIIDVEVPEQLEAGAILVETSAATICATDVHRWDGSAGSTGPMTGPVILGHEMTGRVVRMGEGVTQDSVGQPLALGDCIVWAHGFCGQCEQCVVEHQPTLCDNLRLYMSSPCNEYPFLTGGFAEYCYVFPTAGRVKVPDTIGDDTASASACALRTVVAGFDRLGGIDSRQSVIIQGSGPLGLFAVAMASRAGSSKVIVIGGPKARLDLAEAWGADHTIDIASVPDPSERAQMVMDLTSGRGGDIVLELSGVPAAFNEGVDLLRPGGRYVIVGQTHAQSVPFNPSQIMMKHATLIGSRGATIDHYYRALAFMERNADRFTWQSMISSHYPLADINDAMARMQTWQEIKPAITFAA